MSSARHRRGPQCDTGNQDAHSGSGPQRQTTTGKTLHTLSLDALTENISMAANAASRDKHCTVTGAACEEPQGCAADSAFLALPPAYLILRVETDGPRSGRRERWARRAVPFVSTLFLPTTAQIGSRFGPRRKLEREARFDESRRNHAATFQNQLGFRTHDKGADFEHPFCGRQTPSDSPRCAEERMNSAFVTGFGEARFTGPSSSRWSISQRTAPMKSRS